MSEIKEDCISVIIPVYKVEKYIGSCIESVCCQTYRNLEIILVDDGSPDASGQIAESYAAKDERIRVIHQENKGLSGARNCGLSMAHGEWIVFVDSDDFLHPEMIRILHQTALQQKVKLVWCSYERITEDAVFAGNGLPEQIAEDGKKAVKMTRLEAGRQFYLPGRISEAMVAWNKIYHKSLFQNAKDKSLIRYPEGKLFEDGFTTCKLVYQAPESVRIRAKLYYYRIREDSIMALHGNRDYLPVMEAGRERLAFYDSYGEKELYRLELNMTMHSVIRFYEGTKEKKSRKELKQWFRYFYEHDYRKEKWPIGKTIRFKSFLVSYPMYHWLGHFEKIYNHYREKRRAFEEKAGETA